MIETNASDPSGRKRGRAPYTHNLVNFPSEFVAQLEHYRQSNRNVPVMQNLGISDNTWRKIRAGQAIRSSVAARLLDRFAPDAAG